MKINSIFYGFLALALFGGAIVLFVRGDIISGVFFIPLAAFFAFIVYRKYKNSKD